MANNKKPKKPSKKMTMTPEGYAMKKDKGDKKDCGCGMGAKKGKCSGKCSGKCK